MHSDSSDPQPGDETGREASVRLALTEGGRIPDAPPHRAGTPPRPILTYLLIAANVVVFLFQEFRWGLEASIRQYGQDQFAVWDGEIWRLATAPFLHGFWSHLAMNCLGLLLLGEIVEWRLGRWKMLLIYLLSGFAGGVVFQTFPATTGVGASGAVYGLVGPLLVIRFGRVVQGRLRLTRAFFVAVVALPLIDWVFAWLIQTAFEIHVATTAHLGGLICGTVVGYVSLSPKPLLPVRRRWITGVVGSAMLAALFVYSCYVPFLNPVWSLWKSVESSVVEGNVDPESVDRLAESIESPEVFLRVMGLLLERGREIDAGARAAEEQGRHEEAEAQYAKAGERYREAVRIWKLLGSRRVDGVNLSFVVGHTLFDELMGMGVDAVAKEVLAGLIEIARRQVRGEPPEDADNDVRLKYADDLNNLAWFLALQGEDLGDALIDARKAVQIVGEVSSKKALSFLDQTLGRARSAYLNTLGWVEFLLAQRDGDLRNPRDRSSQSLTEVALKHLREAAELEPLGANFLYLGMAYAALGDERAAVDAIRKAEKAGDLSAAEQRLLREAKAELGI